MAFKDKDKIKIAVQPWLPPKCPIALSLEYSLLSLSLERSSSISEGKSPCFLLPLYLALLSFLGC